MKVQSKVKGSTISPPPLQRSGYKEALHQSSVLGRTALILSLVGLVITIIFAVLGNYLFRRSVLYYNLNFLYVQPGVKVVQDAPAAAVPGGTVLSASPSEELCTVSRAPLASLTTPREDEEITGLKGTNTSSSSIELSFGLALTDSDTTAAVLLSNENIPYKGDVIQKRFIISFDPSSQQIRVELRDVMGVNSIVSLEIDLPSDLTTVKSVRFLIEEGVVSVCLLDDTGTFLAGKTSPGAPYFYSTAEFYYPRLVVSKLVQSIDVCGELNLSKVSYNSLSMRHNLLPPMTKRNIINGTDAPPIFPFFVRLRGTSGSAYCGGSVISPTAILTASHCIDQVGVPTSIDVGVNGDGSEPVEVLYREDYEAAVPSTFSMTSKGYIDDFSFIRLKQKKLTVQPIRLGFHMYGDFEYAKEYDEDTRITSIKDDSINIPSGTYLQAVSEAQRSRSKPIVIGYGKTESGSVSSRLLGVAVPYVPSIACNKLERGSHLQTHELCTAFLTGSNLGDACQGDSGGPLLATQNGAMRQVGVVSWGVGCSVQGSPGVYSRTANFIDRALSTLGQLDP